MDMILQVNNLSNIYEGELLLREVSFSLEEGEILCLLGPSGSGKTTLLRLLAGLEQESGGEILFAGKALAGVAPHKRHFGMMFQEYALFPHKDVFHNVAFGLEMQRCGKVEKRARVGEMLELVGLGGFGGRMVDELSGGERQRVALARSLAPKPRLLLLDEPLGSLDRELRERLALEIRAILKGAGVTAIFVTHDQAEAFTVADRIGVLQNGALQQIAAPENLYRSPANARVARFLGFGNLIAGRVDDEGMFRHDAINLQMPGSVSDREGLLLIRPEGAHLSDGGEEPSLTGTVSGLQFLGSRYRLSMLVDGVELVFELPLEPRPPAVGAPVAVVISPSSLILLEE